MATLKRNRTHSLGVRIWEPSDENQEKRTPSPQRWALLEDIAAGMLTPQEMAENTTLQLRIYCITPTLTVLKSTLSATAHSVSMDGIDRPETSGTIRIVQEIRD